MSFGQSLVVEEWYTEIFSLDIPFLASSVDQDAWDQGFSKLIKSQVILTINDVNHKKADQKFASYIIKYNLK